MEVNIMKIRPFRGKFLTRRKANYINDLLQSATITHRSELEKEAKEFEIYMLEKRKNRHICKTTL